jgi:hypothetical protein
VNVIFGDEWELVPLIRNWFEHGLSFRELWAQHAYNRLVFPKLLILMTAHLTSFNTKAYMYVCAALLVASYVCLVCLYARLGSGSLMTLVPTSYVYFGLVQWENALWGFQMAWYLVLFCLIAGLSALSWLESQRPFWNKAALPVALALSTVASFSSLQGLFVWPCGLFYLICRRSRQVHIWIWVVWGSVVSVLYFAGLYFVATGGPPLMDFARNPARSLEYFFTVPGSIFPFFHVQGIIGLLLVGVSLWIVARAFALKQKGTLSIEAAFIIFALLFDLSLVPGRSGFGVAQAQSSRYTTYNLLLLVAIYLAFLSIARTAVRRRTLVRNAVVLFGALLLLQVTTSFQYGLATGRAVRERRIMAADVLVNYRAAEDSFISRYVYPNAGVLRERASVAEAYRLSVFSTTEADIYRRSGIVPGGEPDKALTVPFAIRSLLAEDASAHEAWLFLSIVYWERTDLQNAFPRASADFPEALLHWAVTSGVTVDSEASLLLPYRQQFEMLNDRLSSKRDR